MGKSLSFHCGHTHLNGRNILSVIKYYRFYTLNEYEIVTYTKIFATKIKIYDRIFRFLTFQFTNGALT